MSDFIIYAMCPSCMVMHGPFASDKQRNQFYDNVHDAKCVGVRQVPKAHRNYVARESKSGAMAFLASDDERLTITPVKQERTYAKGDSSRTFGSGYDGSCYQCGFGYLVGDMIRMVTVKDGEKGKAVHDGCADELLDSIWGAPAEQTDEPPF